MTPSSSIFEVPVAPGRSLSWRRPQDYCAVMYWTLWSPLMFVTYGDELLLQHGESGFPARSSQRRLDRWWARNTGQRELVVLATWVCILMFAGIAAVNAVFAEPLVPTLHEQVIYRSVLFALFFGAFWVCQLAAGWLIARQDGNVGFLLIAALPLAVFAAILLQFACWLPYAATYLEDTSFAGRAVFLICGFGVGYCINFALAMLKVEPARPIAVAGWYLGGVLVAFLYLFLLSGTPAQPVAAIWEAAQATIWTTWLLWSLGFLLGFVRPLEGIYYWLRPQPNTSRWKRSRVWSTPGATLLPSCRVRHALGAWLEQDWHQGVRVATVLSFSSRQQRPLVEAVSRQLRETTQNELPERLATVCDSGAACALDMVKPPNMSRRPKRRKDGAASASAAPAPAAVPAPASPPAAAPANSVRTVNRFNQESALADALRQKVRAPVVADDGRQNSAAAALQAAWWYYGQGYLFETADIIDKYFRSAGGSPLGTSPRVVELGALVATFQALLDLRSAAETPTAALPPRPAAVQRPLAWTMVDGFITAARWMWRAQRCMGRTREACRQMFLRELGRIERKSGSSTLVERKLIGGIVLLWRDQAKVLLADAAAQTQFVRVKLRPWAEVYAELDGRCPWLHAGGAFYRCWQPGRTTVTFVVSQPDALATRAVEIAVERKSDSYILIACNMAAWASKPGAPSPSLHDFCAHLCETLAAKLNCADQLPATDELRKRSLPAVCRLFAELCARADDRCVVLALDNAHRLLSRRRPWPNNGLWLAQLGRLEKEIPNLALTIHSRGGELVRSQLWTRLGLPTEPCLVHVPVLSRRGVQLWLSRQFDAAGVCCDESGLERAYRLTGGHPSLLAVLSQCVAMLYNNLSETLPQGPIIDAAVVDIAADCTQYRNLVGRFSRTLAADLESSAAKRPRLMLYLLACKNFDKGRPAYVRDIADDSISHEILRVRDIQPVFDAWEEMDVLERVAGETQDAYWLRSRSFAEWLVARGYP